MSYDKGGTAWCSLCNVLVIPVKLSIMGEPFCSEKCQREYETNIKNQLAQQADLLRQALEVSKWAGSLNVATSKVGKDFPKYVRQAQALIPALEAALEKAK